MKFEALVNTIELAHQQFNQLALKAVNASLTLRNWLIGYYIVEYEQSGDERAQYGEKLLSQLSERCSHIKGLDERSFRNFRLLYKAYPQIQSVLANQVRQGQILGTLTQESGGIIPVFPIWGSLTTELDEATNELISIWGSPTTELSNTDNRLSGEVIIQKLSYTHLEQLIRISNELQRTFYEIECIKGNWSVRELKRQIGSLYFERSGMSAKPEKLSKIVQLKAETFSPTDVVKSVYAFEFLGLKAKDALEESDLETALLNNLQDFMLEMGHGFCLEARQKKILIGDEYFFIDLVFYHRILKCHVLVELKVEDFNHHNIGQLNTYVNYYKAEVMQKNDHPPVGILLVTQKNNALVEYATAGMNNKLFVSRYLLELPKKEALEAFVKRELEKLK